MKQTQSFSNNHGAHGNNSHESMLHSHESRFNRLGATAFTNVPVIFVKSLIL